jgi:hypothetical protein
MINLGDIFTVVQSIMSFLIISDVFYERIIQHKLIPKISSNIGLLGLDRDHTYQPRCDECLHRSSIGEQRHSDLSSARSFRSRLKPPRETSINLEVKK